MTIVNQPPLEDHCYDIPYAPIYMPGPAGPCGPAGPPSEMLTGYYNGSVTTDHNVSSVTEVPFVYCGGVNPLCLKTTQFSSYVCLVALVNIIIRLDVGNPVFPQVFLTDANSNWIGGTQPLVEVGDIATFTGMMYFEPSTCFSVIIVPRDPNLQQSNQDFTFTVTMSISIVSTQY